MYVYGTVGPDYGSASLSLNGQMVAPNLNLTVSMPKWKCEKLNTAVALGSQLPASLDAYRARW